MATPAEQLPHTEGQPEREPFEIKPEMAINHIRLIGIAGAAGTGKSTLAQYIIDRYGAVELCVADPIKEACNQIFGFPKSAWDDREWKETPIAMIGRSPRQLAQTLGTQWGRQLVNEDLWISKVMGRWANTGNALSVIPDIRFPNEALYLLRSGGLMIKLERPDAPPVAPHLSEMPIDDNLIHFTLTNDGSIEQLLELFDEVLVTHTQNLLEAQKQQVEMMQQGNAG